MVDIALRGKADHDHCDLLLYTFRRAENSANRVGGSSRLGNILEPSSCLEKKILTSLMRLDWLGKTLHE